MDGPLSAGPSPGPQSPPSRSLRGRWDRGHHWCVAGRSCPRLRPKWLVLGCACAVTPRDSTCVQCRSANTSRCQAGRCRCAHGLPASPPSPAGPQSREMPRAGADSTVRAWGGPCPPAQPPPAPGRGGGGAGRGLPGGAAVPLSGGLQQAPLRSASRGCRPAGKCRRGCRLQRCCAEEEGSPPRGSLCLHWCFLPDSDCFALGSWLSALCLRPAPQEPAGQGGFGDGGRVASPWHPRNGTA